MENWQVLNMIPTYEISDLGNIRAISGQQLPIDHPHHKNKGGNINRCGARIINLYNPKIKRMKTYYVAVLMKQWLPKKPSPLHMIFHINLNKTDNQLTNLKWMTQSEINKYRMKLGVYKYPPNPLKTKRLTKKEQKKIINLHSKGLSQVKIGKKIKRPNSTISKFLKRMGLAS